MCELLWCHQGCFVFLLVFVSPCSTSFFILICQSSCSSSCFFHQNLQTSGSWPRLLQKRLVRLSIDLEPKWLQRWWWHGRDLLTLGVWPANRHDAPDLESNCNPREATHRFWRVCVRESQSPRERTTPCVNQNTDDAKRSPLYQEPSQEASARTRVRPKELH